MIVQPISQQNFNGKLIFIDKYGKPADRELKYSMMSQLGEKVSELQNLIAKKPFDLFISRKTDDSIGINANKTFAGGKNKQTPFRSLHKVLLEKITQIAKISIEEYEKYLQKNV